ncbi:putative retrotransposon gag domain, retrotransposon Copia-like protein [Helianthus annuus]|nr:putative retrotransposon gag domain, retrotransposon Copia-like protein [Helianthus annuus]
MTGKDDNAGSSQTLISKLDIGDPLFLHPSDSSSLTIVGIKLKGTENYRVWSSAMKLALEAKNKFGFIDGKCKKNTDDEVLSSQWDRCNSVVLSWLLNSVSEELYLGQVFSKLASDVWTDLKETYDKVDGSIVYDLYKKINCITQNGSSVSEYYHKLNTMWTQFDAVLQLPSCSCQAAKDYNDFSTLIKLMQFLMGLDDVYQPVRTNLLTREPLPPVKVAFSIVSREESHRNSSVGTKSQNVSFVSKTGQNFEQKRKEVKGAMN